MKPSTNYLSVGVGLLRSIIKRVCHGAGDTASCQSASLYTGL